MSPGASRAGGGRGTGPRGQLALGLLLGLQALAAAAELPITPFSGLYRLYVNDIPIGHQEVTLTRDTATDYRYTARTTSNGLAAFIRDDTLTEISYFDYDGKRIKPQKYEFHHVREDHERHVRILFDWDEGRVTNEVQGESWRMSVPEHALDKLVVQLAMILDLQQGRREMEYAIADGGKLKTYRFQHKGRETIRTPAGRYRAVKLERIRADQDRTTYLWAAPELSYLPVQIKQYEHEDGVVYLSRLVARDPLEAE